MVYIIGILLIDQTVQIDVLNIDLYKIIVALYIDFVLSMLP